MTGLASAATLMLLDSHGANRGLEERLTSRPSTVRTHLRHVFVKAATRGQCDPTRLIAKINAFRLV
ncbi:hypothetical protein [Paraburkholderia youngii]|uniref:hypothetical protein n=1 Tax=Paraburkholderia youngii TaxID=2782701 RepID=UPI003D2035B7